MLQDETLIRTIQSLGRKLEEKLDNGEARSSTVNPQTHFQSFKNEIAGQTRARAKVTVPKINLQIQHMREECTTLLKKPDVDNNTESQLSIGILEERIAQLENFRYKKARTATAAHDKLEGETISKYWSEVNKSRTPRDAIYTLEKPDTVPAECETKSKNMAELARNYHHNLLSAGLDTPPAMCETILSEVLASVHPDDTLQETDKEAMGSRLSEQDVLYALKSSKNGTATGMNGLPYKLWKMLNEKYEADTKADRPSFNIIKTQECLTILKNMEWYLPPISLKAGCALSIRKRIKDI
jgi:hypothetical protein